MSDNPEIIQYPRILVLDQRRGKKLSKTGKAIKTGFKEFFAKEVDRSLYEAMTEEKHKTQVYP